MSDSDSPARQSRIALSEDWAATVVGLILVVLALTGTITDALVP